LKVEKLIIHHSFTKDGKVVDWEAIRKYHTSWRYNGNIITQEKANELMGKGVKGVEAPWADIGYHYGIELVNDDYVLQKGRLESKPGAHTVGMNSKSLGICVVGNYDNQVPEHTAIDILVGLCIKKCTEYGLSADDIETHNKYASYKTCPGTMFPMDEVKARVSEIMKKAK
jgi:N-acetylmuramoyl-L-alanine amidase